MHLLMKMGLSGPSYSVSARDKVPFDEKFPFTANEVHRFRAAEYADLVGSAEEVADWLKANPPTEETTVDAGADAATAAADTAVSAAAATDAAATATNAATIATSMATIATSMATAAAETAASATSEKPAPAAKPAAKKA